MLEKSKICRSVLVFVLGYDVSEISKTVCY